MRSKLLLTAVFGPYGIKDDYAERLGMQMELLDNQITRGQGVHSPRQAYWTFPLYLLAENISVPTTVLDFPTWKDFTQELRQGYTHVGINFIVPNVLKAKRMAEYIRANHPETKIILGGYGAAIPDLQKIVPHDAACIGDGVRWLQRFFGEADDKPLKHPAIHGPAYEYAYGFKTRPKGAVLLSGLGCENACPFCVTSHQFNKTYVPILATGKDVFDACIKSNTMIGSSGFTIMDENFLKKPQRARELLHEMTVHKRAFVFDIFSSAEVIKQVGVDFLVRLGIRMIWIGVESKAFAHQKIKGIDLKQLIEELQSHGIVVNASAMLFQEHHDRRTLHEDIDWVIGLGSNLTQFMNYTPLPVTTLYTQLKNEGRLKDLNYRYIHGQGELAQIHQHINDPKEHCRYLLQAFQKKYRQDGPGILNMARTAIRGYRRALEEYQERQQECLSWNPETLRYERGGMPCPDEFMRLRIGKMKRIAQQMRPILPAAWVFSPNTASRRKALETMRLFNETLGKPTFKDRIASLVILTTGTIEFLRIIGQHAMGREGIIRQPPCRRVDYTFDHIGLDVEDYINKNRPLHLYSSV
jgi:hypothetical protein